MKTHRTDGVSLSFGLVFLFIVGWWVLAQFVTLALPAVGWMVAIALILFGVFGLVGAFRSGRGAVPAPTSGVPVSGTPDTGLPTGMHADIVRELMENQRTSGGDEPTLVERAPAPTAAFQQVEPAAAFEPAEPAEPAEPSPYATDYLTVPKPAGDPAAEPAASAASAGSAGSADSADSVDDDKTQVIDEPPTTEIRADGDGERR